MTVPPLDRAAAVRSALRTLVARNGFHGASMSAVADEAGVATGTAIRDTVRQITNSGGTVVYTAVDGLAALKQGRQIKYSGASGPCTFTDIGDITACKFRYNQAENGTFKLLEVS